MCSAKTDEPFEMPFRGLTHVGLRNHVLDGVEIHMQGAVLGVVQPTEKHWDLCCSVCSKKDYKVLNNSMKV